MGFIPAQIASALQPSVNRNTGFMQNNIMLGREVVTLLKLMHTGGLTEEKKFRDTLDYVVNLERDDKSA